jgi:hypothetical protein
MNTIINRQHPGRPIGHDHRNGKRAHPAQPFFNDHMLLLDQGLNTANARAHGNTNPLSVGIRNLQARMTHGLIGRHRRQLLITISTPRIPTADQFIRVKILDLAQAPSNMLALGQERKRPQARFTRQYSFPTFRHIKAQWRYQA